MFPIVLKFHSISMIFSLLEDSKLFLEETDNVGNIYFYLFRLRSHTYVNLLTDELNSSRATRL